jgi:hypothetical protein
VLPRDIIAAWGALIVLSLGTALLATAELMGHGKTAVAAGVLILAALKARVILTRYLGLACSRFWTRAFDLVIGLFLAIAFALYAFGSGG